MTTKLAENLIEGDKLTFLNKAIVEKSYSNTKTLAGSMYPAYVTVRGIEVKRRYVYITFHSYSIVRVKKGTVIELTG